MRLSVLMCFNVSLKNHAWDEGVAGSNPVIPKVYKIKGFR